MPVWRFKNIEGGRLIEQVRKARGVNTVSRAAEIPMIKEAVNVIKESLNEPIAVFGDYDCDGICSAYIMKKALEKAGAKVIVRLPTREEGYGIKPEQVKELKEKGIKTIITVDNGISAVEAVKTAKELGLKIIVTDHHEPKETLPDCIIVNPKIRKDIFREYSGAGVAYKVAEALLESLGYGTDEDLICYASLATVVDMAPIVGPNFDIARKGLIKMRQNTPVGIKAIMDIARINKINGYAFGWQIGPRINSAGRMADPIIAYKLIETNDKRKAEKLSLIIDRLNSKRQDLIEKTVKECMTKYDGSMFPFIVCNYPHGIVGVVAGRIAEAIRRPVLIGSLGEGGIVRASGRSIGSFSIFEALEEAKKRCGLPEAYGGHEKACGLSIDIKDVPKLQAVLNKIAKERLTIKDITEWIDIEGMMTSNTTIDEVEELDLLEPFGEANPEPIFLYKGRIESIKQGDGWQLMKSGKLKFFMDPNFKINNGEVICLAVTPYINNYNGEKEIMCKILDKKTI